MIVAKFRCISILLHVDQATVVRFLPVNPRCASYPDGCEENLAFWEATPSGDLEVHIKHGVELPYNLGSVYYLYLEESDKGRTWKLWDVVEYKDGSGIDIKLGLAWDNELDIASSNLMMGIHNAATFPSFIGKSGTRWSVEIVPVP